MPPTAVTLVPLQEGIPERLLPAQGSFVIGRKVGCDLNVPEVHAYVSGEHCRIHISAETGSITVEDLSANGTYVNAQRVGRAKKMQLRPGDEVSLAKPTRRGGAICFRITEAATRLGDDPLGDDPIMATAEAAKPDVRLPPELAVAPKLSPPASEPPQRPPPMLAVKAVPALAPMSLLTAPAAVTPRPEAAPALAPMSFQAAPAVTPRPEDRVLGMDAPPGLDPVVPRRTPTTTRETPAAPTPVVPSAMPARPASRAFSSTGLAEALARERQREMDELAMREVLGEQETARVSPLKAQLRTAQAEHEARAAGASEALASARSASAIVQGSSRIAEECEKLREQLENIRRESLRLRDECPALEEAAARERRECAQLQLELEAERGAAEESEAEAAALRSKVEEVTGRAQELRCEVCTVTQQNAALEEQCAEAAAESAAASSAASLARQRLHERSAVLAELRRAVMEHSKMVGQSLATLEESLREVPLSESLPVAAAGGAKAPAAGEGRPAAGRGGGAASVSVCPDGQGALRSPSSDAAGNAQPHGAISRDSGAGALSVACSVDEETQTQDADVAAGVPMGLTAATSAGPAGAVPGAGGGGGGLASEAGTAAAAIGAAWTIEEPHGVAAGPLLKRRRLPPSNGAPCGLRHDDAVG